MSLQTFSVLTGGSSYRNGAFNAYRQGNGSAVAFGGGAFLTASHNFDEYFTQSNDGTVDPETYEYVADQMSIGATSSDADQRGFNEIYNLRQFDPAVEKPGTFGTETQLNDLAVVEQPQITTPASSLSPIVVFNNPGDVTAFGQGL